MNKLGTIVVSPGESIQGALDALRQRSGGGTCLLEEGAHTINQPLRIHSNTTLAGKGSFSEKSHN